jgi:membrane dipeptidase
LPVGLEDVYTYPRITQILLDRGYSKRDIGKIMSGNMMRVIRQVERIASQK